MSKEELLTLNNEFAHESTKRENKVVNVAMMRDILEMFDAEEISISKVCEIINCAHIAKRNEYASQVSVAFAKFLDELKQDKDSFTEPKFRNVPKHADTSDLHQYFIDNVYNK